MTRKCELIAPSVARFIEIKIKGRNENESSHFSNLSFVDGVTDV